METRQSNFEYSATLLENIAPIKEIVNPELKVIKQPKIKKETLAYKIIKRTLDIICSLIGIILLVPLIIIVWIGNLLAKDSGPIFYVQKRIGEDGKLFKIYKFRTMVVGADKKLRQYLLEHPEDAKEYRKYKKLKEDPRITKFGMLLRKTSIDEFPQFINVLKGEMSLVGPRPYLLKEKKDMGEYYDYIVKCKPGLTCIWQVNGRNNLSFKERLDLDMEYISKKSLKMDIVLIIKTFIKVFKSEGAV